jgi:AraC-like DNA-binding protein
MKKPYTLTAVVFLVFVFGLALFLLANLLPIGRSVLTAWRNTEGSIVDRLDAATAGESIRNKDFLRVAPILDYIRDNLSSPLTLDQIAAQFYLSKHYLCRIFKESTGTSPVDYWIALKIKEAKKLIRQGSLNMTQISEHLGYSSIHHFTRMFKRVTGLSPTAYKSSVGT